MPTSHAPFRGSAKDIEHMAGMLRSRVKKLLGAGGSPVGGAEVGAFLASIVERLGGKISIAADISPREADGGSLVIAPGGDHFEIRLSPVTSSLRDNFTIAHELGHIFLHYDYDKSPQQEVRFNRYGTDIVEQQ